MSTLTEIDIAPVNIGTDDEYAHLFCTACNPLPLQVGAIAACGFEKVKPGGRMEGDHCPLCEIFERLACTRCGRT